MKKMLALILALALCFTLVTCVWTKDSAVDTNSAFVKVKIPFPESIEDNNAWRTYARYKDTKEPITLSQYYAGNVWATVPKENEGRELEAFVPEAKAFTDIDENTEYFDILWVSRTGIIEGNEKGEAEPLRNVTRAEAVAMVMRFMGFASMPEANQIVNFSDVSKNDWYYSTVMSAYYCGIIKGDSEMTFSPNRNVTREEITVMIANALKYAGLRCPAAVDDNIVDKDKVSDWAKEAYEIIGASYIYDYPEDETDWENPKGLLSPQSEATRLDVARLLNNVQGVCQMYPSDAAVAFGFDKEMPVIDGSTSTYPFTRAVYQSLFSNGLSHSDFPQKHSKSHASYERLIDGEVDMLFASVYPASDILELAKKKGVELELIPIAYDAMIFFTNADNPADGLTQEQITNIYVNNAYDNWAEIGGSDALLYPYCRNNDSGSHAQMEKHFLNGKDIHPEVKKETSYTMSNVLTDVMSAKTENPKGYALGYSIYYYFNNMDLFYNTKTELKLLAIDGVMPSDETIADGTYPLSNNTYIVLRKDTPKDAPARKMAEFMLTEQGQQCVEEAGFGPLKKTKASYDEMVFADKLNVQMPQDKNYVFSPLSVKMALALAANGAEGVTKTEILNAVGITDIDEFNALSKELTERYGQTDILKLSIANSLWINKDKTDQSFSSAFKKTAADYYNADANTVTDKNAVAEINSWVSKKTEGRIPQIVQNSDDFWAMIVNAIYFKGAWQNEFNKGATAPDTFTGADGAKTEIDFMNRTAWMSFAETNDLKIVELPYKNRSDKFSDDGEYLKSEIYENIDVSMYLISSDSDINVAAELEAAINDGGFKSTYIKLSVPKFKIEYSEKLNTMLENIGIETAFDTNGANFGKMFDTGTMFFEKVIHKTFISVDEKGTEAAAVTAIGMEGSSLPPEPVVLKLDKPFYFAIYDNLSGEILFMGRYAYAE